MGYKIMGYKTMDHKTMDHKMKRDLAVMAVAAGSILNIYPSISQVRDSLIQSEYESDLSALAGDWSSIGMDLKASMEQYAAQQTYKK